MTSSVPSSPPPLSLLNYMNVVAYVANLVVTYGIGVTGIAGTPTNAELSEKYQTLVTPIGWAFAIWGIIFISQFIFTIAQLFPTYRSSPMVASAIGYDYVGVCVAQIAWTLSFTYEIIWLSLSCMLTILYYLLTLVNDQYKLQEQTSIRDYILLKFPFAVHCGWILAASFVNLSVTLVDYNVSAMIQYYVGIGTIIAVFCIAAFCLAFPTRPEYVIPIVLAWASIGIYFELASPKDAITATFAQSQIDAIRLGALIASSTIAIMVVLKVLFSCYKARQNNVVNSSDDTENRYLRHDDDEIEQSRTAVSPSSASRRGSRGNSRT